MKIGNLLLMISVVMAGFSCTALKQTETYAYFGSYTRGMSEGIYFAKLNCETGELSEPRLGAKIDNPSFIAIHPNQKFLFAVIETRGDKAAICSFKIEEDGTLSKLSQQASKGDYPCHVSVDATGKTVMIANYNGANCASYPILADGKIGQGSFYEHKGSSINEKRQKAPHPHSINVDPANKRAFVADLGIDQIVIYDLDAKQAKMTKAGSIKLPSGGGPRHFSFHPSGRFAYANLELTREIIAMSYDQNSGKLKQMQKLSTLPSGAKEEGSTAECLVHPSGKFVYVSNRGHNSIAAFKINQQSGLLQRIEVEPTQGSIPRGFGIDPSGKFLVVGHQKTDKVRVFSIDQETGGLAFTGHSLDLNAVVNVRFVEK